MSLKQSLHVSNQIKSGLDIPLILNFNSPCLRLLRVAAWLITFVFIYLFLFF